MSTKHKYELEFTTQAKKDVKRLDKGIQAKFMKEIAKLRDDPYIGSPLKGNLRDFYSLHISLSGGEYRAAYIIDEGNRLVIVAIVGPRENFYDQARRRADAIMRNWWSVL